MWANLFYSRLKSCAVFVYNDYCFTLQTHLSEVTGVTEELQHQWNDTEDQWINSQLNRICAAGTYISRSFLHFTHCCEWCTAQYLEFRDVPVCLLSHSSCLTWDKIIRVWQWKRSKKKNPTPDTVVFTRCGKTVATLSHLKTSRPHDWAGELSIVWNVWLL